MPHYLILLVMLCSLSLSANAQTIYDHLNLFGDALERIRNDYVEAPTDEALIESAINGMLSSLDPHSSYLSPKSFEDMQIETKGEFGGLGIEVTMENGLIKVIAPIDDTPAQRAGVRTNDLITYIDDTPVLGLSLSEAVELMRGKPKTDIRLTILREGEDDVLEMTITRAIIKIRAVRSRIEGDDQNIGYIRITTFNARTDENLIKALKSLQQKIDPERLAGLIVDLRNNPGGLLNQAVGVSDAFLERGEIVSTRGRHSRDSKRYVARRNNEAGDYPLIVLINGGSASASEIVAGALKDHHRAILLGTQSFGKGSVQTITPLSNEGALRMTTALYYTPSGQSIQARGITPHIITEQKIPDKMKNRKQRREASLPGHIETNTTSPSPTEDAKPTKKNTRKPPSIAYIPSDAKDDAQLQKAIEILRKLNHAHQQPTSP